MRAKRVIGAAVAAIAAIGVSVAAHGSTPPPAPTITSGPAAFTQETNPVFTFTTASGTTAECSLDGVDPAPCSSPVGYPALSEGQHTFRVYAVSSDGTVGPPASRTWTIDTTPPVTSFLSTPTDPTTSTTATFQFVANEPVTGYVCSLDGSDFVACTSPRTYSNLARQQHTFLVQSTDRAGNVESNPASFSWTVTLGPNAVDDIATVVENTPRVIDVLANDVSPNGDPLTVVAVGAPTHGSVVNNDDGTVTYTPNTGYVGPDSFTYTVDDGHGLRDTATVKVTVVDPRPVAVNDSVSTPEDTPKTIDVLANDSSPVFSPLSVIAVGTPSHGTATDNGNGSVTYAPAPNYHGPDAFTYTVSDADGRTASATVSVNVVSVNDPPRAVNDYATVQKGKSVIINLLANDSDVDGDALTITSVSRPANGWRALLTHNQGIRYTAPSRFVGTALMTYAISDGHGGTASAKITVTVTA